jgi:hypothetical protein
MSALIRLFWDICTFQRGPQDTPYSPFLLGSLLLIKLVFEFATFFIPDGTGTTLPVSSVVPYLLVDAAVSIGMIFLILWTHGYVARSLQTITATLGVDIILGLAQLPFKFLANAAGNQSEMLVMFYLGTMVIFMWELGVYSHIFRHALATSIFKAGGYALLLFILSFVVYDQMLPVAS